MPVRYLSREQMPEHAHSRSTANEGMLGNIFIDANPEPTCARARMDRARRESHDARHRRGIAQVAPGHPAASSPTPTGRASGPPRNTATRTGPFTSWQDTIGPKSDEHRVRKIRPTERSVGRWGSVAARRGRVATPILAVGIALIALAVYVACRFVASPSVGISRPTRITRTITSQAPQLTSRRSVRRLQASRRARPSSTRQLQRQVASHTASARAHAHPPASPPSPAHARSVPSSAPPPLPRQPSVSTAAAPSTSHEVISGAGTGAGAATSRGGSSGAAPFGPGYPG